MKSNGNPENANNIWCRKGFAEVWSRKECRSYRKLKHFFRCIKWSKQRALRGYADGDIWDMYTFLQNLIPDMLQTLKDTRHGSPGYLGENYTNEVGILVNDTCHAEWDRILEHMIFLWREADEETCSRKNRYEEEYFQADSAFTKEYGDFGEKLRTDEQKEENRKTGSISIHLMDEIPEYKDIYDHYFEEERKLAEYRASCKDEAMDMLKQYFYDLWD